MTSRPGDPVLAASLLHEAEGRLEAFGPEARQPKTTGNFCRLLIEPSIDAQTSQAIFMALARCTGRRRERDRPLAMRLALRAIEAWPRIFAFAQTAQYPSAAFALASKAANDRDPETSDHVAATLAALEKAGVPDRLDANERSALLRKMKDGPLSHP